MIKELLTEELYIESLKASNKKDAILEMVEKLDQSGKLVDKALYTEAVFHRESEFSTGIGMGIAIPHGKSSGVKTPSLVFARSKEGVDFDAMDEKPSFLFFLVAVPEESGDEHLKILSTISRKLMHEDVRNNLMQASSYEAVIEILG